MSERDRKLESLGYPLDRVPKPAATYQPVAVDGDTAYLSGAIPLDGPDGLRYVGRVPSAIGLEDARAAAALCAANLLRVIHAEFGSLDAVERVVRLTGYVNSDDSFTDQHLVINGASELLIEVMGEAGRHARSAVGAAQLPLGSAVEVELIVKIKR